EGVRQILAEIRKDDERAGEAIRRIRALLSKRDMQMQPLKLNEVVGDVLQFVNGDALLRRIEIHTELAERLPLVQGDKVHLQQVLLNLVLNGMEAMAEVAPPKRRLSIGTRQAPGNQVELSVEDNGPGVSSEKLPQIFQSFFTTKKGGMGLGLSMAQ